MERISNIPGSIEWKYNKLLEVMKEIAEPYSCTGDDAVNYQHWAHQILKEMEVMDD